MNENKETQQKSTVNKKKEKMILAIIVIVILVIAVVIYGPDRDHGSEVVITIDGQEYGRYPLAKNAEIPIQVDGKRTNYLVIQNGAADMLSANCPDQLCVNMKEISLNGETIVCLPNKVVVEVESETNTSELDGMAQ